MTDGGLGDRRASEVARPAPTTWVVLFSAMTLALLAGGFWTYQLERTRIVEQRYQDLDAIGQLRSGQIQRWRLERLGDARVLSTSPFVIRAVASLARNPGDDALRKDLRDQLRTTADAYGYSDALLLSPERG